MTPNQISFLTTNQNKLWINNITQKAMLGFQQTHMATKQVQQGFRIFGKEFSTGKRKNASRAWIFIFKYHEWLTILKLKYITFTPKEVISNSIPQNQWIIEDGQEIWDMRWWLAVAAPFPNYGANDFQQNHWVLHLVKELVLNLSPAECQQQQVLEKHLHEIK